MAKTAKSRIFLDTTLAFDDSKQLSQVSDQVLDKSDVWIRRKMSKNLIFWLKMAKNGKNWPFLAKNGQTRIVFKNPLGTFFNLAKMQLWGKFQKNLMCGSPDIASRRHARTHERESIGPSANAERPKINKKSSKVWKKMAKNSLKPYNVNTSNVFLTQKWPKRPKQEFS